VPAAGPAFVGLAEVAYQQDELDAAVEYASQGIALCRQLAYPRPLAAGLAALARIRQAQGDLSGALAALSEYRQAAPTVGAMVSGAGWAQPHRSAVPDRGVAHLLDPVPALRARLLLAQGDLASALRWIQSLGISSDDEVSYPREPEYLLLARLLLVQDLPERALACLDRLQGLVLAQGRTGSLIDILVLRALALAAAGDQPSALTVLAEALSLAYPRGYVRVFADEGAPMGALLGQLVAAQRSDPTAAGGAPLGYLGRLLRTLDHGDGPGSASAARPRAGVSSLIEALSERELEVLRLLAAGMSNQEIADELVVALDTVKKHVSHILAKLGASSRTAATARARELGLLVDATEPRRTSRS
jgi:LuxR family maltose regulon positive regulatory protein